jgi:hypothetical protein
MLPGVSVAGETIVREVTNKMPVGLQLFKNLRSNYHVTIFHTSKHHDPRPDAISPSGGVEEGTNPSERPAPTQVRHPQQEYCLWFV